MLSDPPLIDRLLWREGIQSDTLISNDPGLIARTFGTLYLIGGGLGFVLLLIGEGAEGVYGFFYVWVVFMSFLFFRPAVATAQTAFAAVAYGAVLIATDAPFTGDLLITAAATL